VLLAPAMHTEMWEHPATVENVATLRARGVTVLEPASGRLTGADSGRGRLPEPEEIAAACDRLLAGGSARAGDLLGVRVVVSAGGTREPLDPVRYLGNRSSGRQGVALAATAAARGATVTLVAAHLEVEPPAGVELVRVGSALQLREAMHTAAEAADVLVMAAAVADFRPAEVAEHKIKKSHGPGHEDDAPVVRLVRNPDVLAELVAARRPGQLVVGFAAETGDETGGVLDHARRKLAAKGCDLLVVNDVSAGKVFGQDVTEVTVLAADGSVRQVPEGSKTAVADAVWDVVIEQYPAVDRVGRPSPTAPGADLS
jgi:phosphopantothenoylcysteine decarboxylase/phosphopantothenate--cysteine ligase